MKYSVANHTSTDTGSKSGQTSDRRHCNSKHPPESVSAPEFREQFIRETARKNGPQLQQIEQQSVRLFNRYLNNKDNASFAEACELHRPQLFNIAHRITGDDYLAGQVVEETFCVMKTSLATVAQPLWSWLCLTTAELAIQKCQTRLPADPAENPSLIDVHLLTEHLQQNDPTRRICAPAHERATASAVRNIINRLAEHQRQCVILRFVDGCSPGVVAQKLKLPTATVNQMCNAIVVRLSQEIWRA